MVLLTTVIPGNNRPDFAIITESFKKILAFRIHSSKDHHLLWWILNRILLMYWVTSLKPKKKYANTVLMHAFFWCAIFLICIGDQPIYAARLSIFVMW